jgi:hypothetical protein
MTAQTVWQTDDCCPGCGALLRERIGADGSVIQECGCGWSVTWQANTWTAEQTGGER